MNPFLPPTAKWEEDEHGYWNLRFESMDRKIHAHIGPRPPYCDRGHWAFNVDGISSLDGADCFPRYFMDLEKAKTEAEDWLVWRLTKVPFAVSERERRRFAMIEVETKKYPYDE